MKCLQNVLVLGLLPLLLLGGCNPEGTVRQGSLVYSAKGVFGQNGSALALAEAARHGDVEEVNRLISSGASVNAVGQHGITPLWWAAFADNYQGFAALLDKGANPNAQRQEGRPLMLLVAGKSDVRFLEAALKHGGDPNLRDSESGFTPLFPAVQRGLDRHVDLLLGAKADANARMPVSGTTLPMLAVGARADYRMVFRLFEGGADPAAKDFHGKTLADSIAVVSVNASNNSDPWRKKVLESMRSKGVSVTNLLAP